MNPNPHSVINAFANLKVLVIGDAMLDSYLSGSSDRLSQEAPVPIVNLAERRNLPGGAANTAVNVHSLGANVTFLSVIGDDLEGSLLQRSLEQEGLCTQQLLSVPARRTLAKHRLFANGHMLARYDQGTTEPINSLAESYLADRLMELFPQADALIISDYNYGVLTPRLVQLLAVLQRQTPRIIVVDSKRLPLYRNVQVTAVKPNYSEVLKLLRLAPSDDRVNVIAAQGDRILELTNAQIAAVTLDVEGALLFERGQLPYRTLAQPMPHVKATGAGDTYISALTLALAAHATTPIAGELAAAAAAVVVSKADTAVCTTEELQQVIARTSATWLDRSSVPDSVFDDEQPAKALERETA